jgi:U3 small nucleolar RNA-associated protein 20
MLDSFHFQLEKSPPGDDENVEKDRSELSGNAVWRALENRIIPKVENLLFKEKVGKDPEKIKVLRPQVVLALLKLFQKFPVEVFESKLPRLLAIMCGALKSKDSDSRDVARVTLAKMTTSMSKKYLHQVIHHLSTSLTEGYQLHVRMATLHTILLHTAEQAAVILPASSESAEDRAFDRSIPTMMNLIQDDLFGTARERREAEGAKKRFVKEASGSKSNDAIELICRLLEFKPSLAAEQESGPSAIHCVVMPLLGRLESQDTTAATIGRIRECLSRVIVGLSKNQSVTASEMFPFIYASVSPFIAAQNITQDDDSCSDDEEPDGRIVVSSDKRTNSPQKTEGRSESKPGKVVQWRPSALKISTSNRDARNTKDREHRELHRVRDGYNAPKLTGSERLRPTANTLSETLNNPASICAVLFGLGLLHSTLKKTKLSNEPRTSEMVDPFIPLLTTCLCASKDDDVILLSIRCLVLLLRMPLPSVERCSTDVGAKVMDILTLSGSLTNLNQELTQSCFKVLTLLISKVDVQKRTDVKTFDADHENALSSGQTLPLDPTQMQALISLLKGAVVDTDHHNPSFGLIKAITSRRYISAEFYDLMETCLELSVRSQKVAVRQVSIAGCLLGGPLCDTRAHSFTPFVAERKYLYAISFGISNGKATSRRSSEADCFQHQVRVRGRKTLRIRLGHDRD